MRMTDAPLSWKKGGCHCGAVSFEVLAPDDIEVRECNCSICRMMAYLHLIVPKERFRLLAGEGRLVTYAFNTRTARHLFCSVCGIKSFYVPRSKPDGYTVNVRCVEEGAFRSVRVTPFDGKHWERAVAAIAGTEAREP
jgi:hypothetical protein